MYAMMVTVQALHEDIATMIITVHDSNGDDGAHDGHDAEHDGRDGEYDGRDSNGDRGMRCGEGDARDDGDSASAA